VLPAEKVGQAFLLAKLLAPWTPPVSATRDLHRVVDLFIDRAILDASPSPRICSRPHQPVVALVVGARGRQQRLCATLLWILVQEIMASFSYNFKAVCLRGAPDGEIPLPQDVHKPNHAMLA
jgi:hypothetical protein